MPVLVPAELWRKTGRYDIDELFKLKDRRGAELVLSLSHEEVLTWHIAREVRSYRDLPQLLYHFQTKERDEPRPRAGLLRTREFIMKDAVLLRPRPGRARRRRTSCSSRPTTASSTAPGSSGTAWSRDVGMMGGFGAHEYMAPCAAGENDVALSDAGYAANVEIASADAAARGGAAGAVAEPREVETPGATTIEAVCQLLGVPPGALIKAFPILVEERGPVLVVIRGDHRLNEIKLQNTLGAPFRAAEAEEVREPFGAEPGFIGPVGAPVPVLADEALRDLQRPGGGREQARPPPDRGRAGSRLRARVGRRAARRAGRPRPGRQRDPHRAGDRGGQHLQARHPLLRPARRALPRRGGQGAADLDGLVRDRPGPHGRGRHRAVRRRAGHLVATRGGAVRRRARDARQARGGGALAVRPALRRAARAGPRRPLRRPRRRSPGREVRRRGAARLPAARDDRQEERRGRARSSSRCDAARRRAHCRSREPRRRRRSCGGPSPDVPPTGRTRPLQAARRPRPAGASRSTRGRSRTRSGSPGSRWCRCSWRSG